MTREELAKAIREDYERKGVWACKSNTINMQLDFEMLGIILEALEQEPCEDEYIKVPKKALKYRTAGMVAYNAEWLKNHFDIERAVICGAQEPCDVFDEYGNYKYPSDFVLTEPNTATSMPYGDVISRQAVLEQIDQWAIGNREYLPTNAMHYLTKRIQDIPPVNPTKTGHWITKDGKEQGYDIAGIKTWYTQIMCSECGFIKTAIEGHTGQYHYCPNCGARMFEPQESEE